MKSWLLSLVILFDLCAGTWAVAQHDWSLMVITYLGAGILIGTLYAKYAP